MSDAISPETRQKLDALCEKLRLEELDESVRREVVSHLEDKLSAYLSGKEKLTDDDCIMLVEKHFGGAKAIHSGIVPLREQEECWVSRLIPALLFSLSLPALQLFFAWAWRHRPGGWPAGSHGQSDISLAVQFAVLRPALTMILAIAAFYLVRQMAFVGLLSPMTRKFSVRAGQVLAAMAFVPQALVFVSGNRAPTWGLIDSATMQMGVLYWLLLVDRGRGAIGRVAALAGGVIIFHALYVFRLPVLFGFGNRTPYSTQLLMLSNWWIETIPIVTGYMLAVLRPARSHAAMADSPALG